MHTETPRDTSRRKRAYTKLSPTDWDRLADLYSSGGVTLADIAHRYRVSVRAIQIHLSKRKPASPAPTIPAITAKLRLLAPVVLTAENHEACVTETKAAVYANAVAIQAILGDALAEIQASTDLPPTARVRACDQAAVTLDRVNKVRRTVLGMSKEDDIADRPLPEFIIRELTASEERAIRDQNALEDGALGFSAPADDSGELDEKDDLIEE